MQIVLSAWVVECTDCISAEGLPPPPDNECPGYDTKQSVDNWGMQSIPSLPSHPGSL